MSWRKPLRWLRERVRQFGRGQESDSEDTLPLLGEDENGDRPAGVEQAASGRWRQYPAELNPFEWPSTDPGAAASTPLSETQESETQESEAEAESPQAGAARPVGRSVFYTCRDPNSALPPLPVGPPPFVLRTPPPPYDFRRRARPNVETPGQFLGVPLDLHRGRRDLRRVGAVAEEGSSHDEEEEEERYLLLRPTGNPRVTVGPANPEIRHLLETARLERLAAGAQALDQTYTVDTSSEDELYTTAREEPDSSSAGSGRRVGEEELQSSLPRPSDR